MPTLVRGNLAWSLGWIIPSAHDVLDLRAMALDDANRALETQSVPQPGFAVFAVGGIKVAVIALNCCTSSSQALIAPWRSAKSSPGGGADGTSGASLPTPDARP
jgi:hypothetical protein